MAAASPAQLPEKWPLTPEGRAAAQRLVAHLPDGAMLASSTERKACETLNAAHGAIRQDPRFNEIHRPGSWDPDVRERRSRYVAGAVLPGWEAQDTAAARFDEGVKEHQGAADRCGVPLVVATHGMVITVWMVARGHIPAEQAANFWRGLRFPDIVRIQAPGS